MVSDVMAQNRMERPNGRLQIDKLILFSVCKSAGNNRKPRRRREECIIVSILQATRPCITDVCFRPL